MKWNCRLYGHAWRHPGPYEVVVREGSDPTVRFECATCAATMQLVHNE